MNILYIWDADYPWDIRVEKICGALKRNGHGVHIASRNLRKKQTHETVNGIHIHRLKVWRNNRINYFMTFPLFFSPVWKTFLDNIIENHNINVLIVRDLPMALAGIWAGKKFNIPMVFDMAEDYVAMIRDIWDARKFQGLNFIIRNPYFAKFVEHYAFKYSDQILVVVDEAIEVVKNGGGDTKKITVVSNTPDLASFDIVRCAQNDDIDMIKKHYSVIYTGGIQMGRGIQHVLGAMPKIIQDIPNFLFVIIGDGYATQTLQKIIIEKSLGKHVLWVGWIEHFEVYNYIKACKAGIIPHLVTNHVDTTIPNKIFDYMGCGIPVVSSAARPLKRIIDEEQCGLTFKSPKSESIAQAILQIFNSNMNFGRNGKNAVRYKYNWSHDEKKLNNVLEKFK